MAAPLPTGPSPRSDARRFGLFLCVGLAGLTVDATVFWLVATRGMPYPFARAFSLACATLVTWQLNRRFTFAAEGDGNSRELLRYALVTATAQGTSYAIFLGLTLALPGLHALVALGLGAALATGVSFAGQRFITFRAAC